MSRTRNSSKPPSSDGYAKQPAAKNKKRSLRRRSGRKPGGRHGHKGHDLQRRKDPDRTELHEVKTCECCGRDLSAAPIEQSQSRQVFDLLEMPAAAASVGVLRRQLARERRRQHPYLRRLYSRMARSNVLLGPRRGPRSGSRCVVVDLGSLPTREEQSLVAGAVLSELWRRRRQRKPILIVIDEAHNVCPAEPPDQLTALAAEHVVRIAAEGRKFGLYLLISTQRPPKIPENVLSQADNLVPLRLNSLADAAFAQAAFLFVPPSLIEASVNFRQCEALIAGKISPHPALLRFGARISEAGGSRSLLQRWPRSVTSRSQWWPSSESEPRLPTTSRQKPRNEHRPGTLENTYRFRARGRSEGTRELEGRRSARRTQSRVPQVPRSASVISIWSIPGTAAGGCEGSSQGVRERYGVGDPH